MNEQELLATLDSWIQTLPEDAMTLRRGIDASGASRNAKKLMIGGLAYLLRKIDLIPDYMGGIGMTDDAAVLRMAASLAVEAGFDSPPEEFESLAAQDEALKMLLGDLYDRFVTYVKKLPETKIRNRTADMILDDPDSLEQFDHELEDEVRTYRAKPVGNNPRVLDEFRAFVKAKI